MLDALARVDPRVHWDRVLFSAKESIYKAWFPLERRWLGFEEARLIIDPDARTFVARLAPRTTRPAARTRSSCAADSSSTPA